MTYHILNGDALARSFADTIIAGDLVVVREALIDGDLSGANLREFWQSRANYMGLTEDEYQRKVVLEFEKLIDAPDNSEFFLWFEYDLFCQVNMWFVLSVINSLPIKKKVFAVYTSYLDKNSKDFWNGFGPASSSDLQVCLDNRIPLTQADLQLGQDLWASYKDGDPEKLQNLGKRKSAAFPYLQDVIQAQVDRFPKDGTKGRPEKFIEDIIRNGSSGFHEVFKAFWDKESIYGFGDIQLKHLYDKVTQYR